MSRLPGNALLEALKAALAFEPLGSAAGNVTAGRGQLDGNAVHVALVENRIASGSIGKVEAKRLGALFQVAAKERTPLVVFLDSAGAKVSEGLQALGGFRRVYRAGLAAALAGTPIACVLGKNCFGGASMLAHLAQKRLFGAQTQLAMSGPSILAATAGMNVLDEMFRAMAEASISAGSRAQASAANSVFDAAMPLEPWLREALRKDVDAARAWHARHVALGERLKERADTPPEEVRRRDLERLYADGCELREVAGLLEGTGRNEAGEERLLGIVGKAPLGAERAWRFADAAWRQLPTPPRKLRVLLDCATHAARLDDERIVLTEFIVGMSVPLALLAARGVDVELTVLGEAGGGVYVALAGPARQVSAVYGANIRVLPGNALAAILGETKEETVSASEYRLAGVAEEEIKLGMVPR